MFIDLDEVKSVLAHEDEHTLTLYLNVDNATPENQTNPPAWRIWVKNTLRDMPATLSDEQAAAWPFIHQWVDDFLDDYQPTTKGLLIFAGSSYQHTYELPVPLENQATFGLPNVGALLWAIDEYEPYLVALVDQEKARFFSSYLGAASFQQGMEIDVDEYDFGERTSMANPAPSGGTRGSVHGGSAKDDFDDTLHEHRARFYRGVVDTLDKLLKRHNTRRLILGGSEESVHAVINEMPEALKACVVDHVSVPMRTPTAEIFEQMQPLALNYERDQELSLVNQVIDFAKSGGRGALGRKDVQEAMEMQRVELLIMPWPTDDVDFANRLAFRALQLNSKIEMVHGAAAMRLNDEGGLAARLYYVL
jgi:hypothetical protein